jgi:hypothetical protein
MCRYCLSLVSGYQAGDYNNIRPIIDSVTPEPTALVLMGLGAVVLLHRDRRQEESEKVKRL